jgi:hypothetical protein
MRFVLAAAIVASLAVPAFAQQSHVPQYGEAEKDKTVSQKAAEKAAADAYKRSLSAIPDKGPGDPWGGVRSTDAPSATATKTAKSKAKTGAETKPQ